MERGILTCSCKKKVKEIGTTNNVPDDFLPIVGLDLTEKIDVNYHNTESTKFPNDKLEQLDGKGEPFPTDGMYSYEKKPHEPYLSEYYPEQAQNLAVNDHLSIPYPYDDQHAKNYVATGSKINSEPSMHNEEGHLSTDPKVRGYENHGNQDRIYDLPPQYLQETEKKMAKYVRYPHRNDILCEVFDGKIIDLNGEGFRPVPPSEDSEHTNTATNCKCYWLIIEEPEPEVEEKEQPRDETTGQFQKEKDVHDPYKLDTFTKLEKEQEYLSQRTSGANPMKEIKETLQELHYQFNWFTDDYLGKIADLDKSIGGKFVLIRASAETITDHRSEGEPYRRLLKGEELMQLTRTGIGKNTDINHLGKEFKVDSQVLDAEYDPIRKESQMLVHLKDPEIIRFIETGQISEVSINAGAPRRMDTECNTGECFVVPTGLILGELDGIAFTWVVTDPAGIVWRGKYIPKATAGVKTTKIEII